MPDIHIDYLAVEQGGRGSEDTDGTSWEADILAIPVCIPVEDINDWLAAYDPDSEQSPSAADSRKIARAVLDALKRASEQS